LNHVFSIGVDIVNVTRFRKKPLRNNLNFYKKIFSESEINYCKKFSSPYEHFAGKFAIKESVIKAIPDKISLKNICILNSKHKPEIKINGKLNKKYNFIVSVSHEKEFAIAVVISFRK
jgi:holo-[acyl-carrier protein] synthase